MGAVHGQSMTLTIDIDVAGKTDVGCVRTNNEDNFGYDPAVGIYVVCDGIGGAVAGEVASKLAVESVLNYFRQAAGGNYPLVGKPMEGKSPGAQALASAIQMANQAIYQSAAKNVAHRGMGSTIVSVLANGQALHIGHVGDSRIYLVRRVTDAYTIEQLTNDHSLVMEQVRHGLITKEEAEHSALQNIIIRALGSEETVEPEVDDIVPLPGDILLLTTDGLTKHAKDDQILNIITSAPSLEAACGGLIQAAKDGGGEDNITCLLLRVTDSSGITGFWRKVMTAIIPGGKPNG